MFQLVDCSKPYDLKQIIFSHSPIIFKSATSHWPAIKKWSFDFFGANYPNFEFDAKYFVEKEVRIKTMLMKEFLNVISDVKNNKIINLPYCHDVPIFNIKPELAEDVGSDFIDVLPRWYQSKWTNFTQFFMSIKGSYTPLHFDTLMTNNLFFQIMGEKQFYLVPYVYAQHCNRRGWRWFDMDLRDDSAIEKLKNKGGLIWQVKVEAGDVLYMPPTMLHQVVSETDSISFNIDFHTPTSALYALRKEHIEVPKDNLKYNEIIAKAILFGDQSNQYFDLYESYLSYQS